MAAVVALAFSGLLILAQVGIFVGIGKGFTAQIDRARADIMVLGPGAKALFGGPSGLPRRMIPLVYSHPEVTQVAPLDGSGGRFQNILSPEQQAKEEARAKSKGKGKPGGSGQQQQEYQQPQQEQYQRPQQQPSGQGGTGGEQQQDYEQQQQDYEQQRNQ